MRQAAPIAVLLTALLAGGEGAGAFAASGDDFSKAEPEEALSAGTATSIAPPDRSSFQHMNAALPAESGMRFQIGRAMFRKLWVAPPSSTQASDGLGPLFNARSCESCHSRDGRGRPPEPGEKGTGFLLRLSPNPVTPSQAQKDRADPVYGTQLQDMAVPGLAAEGELSIRYGDLPLRLGDGAVVTLRKPDYTILHPGYGPLDPQTTLSPRLAPPMIGLGLIEAIPEAAIRAGADPEDRDGDGISGRAAEFVTGGGRVMLGRFGWKAEQPTVRAQTAAALSHDIGISSPESDLPFGDCTARQDACLSRPSGVQPRLGKTEIPAEAFDALVFYTENLAVPARRKASFPDILAGKAVFHGLGCAACHTPSFAIPADATNAALGEEIIRPYSDFLLHDMGEGLADGQVAGSASGTEWRTPPLWGLGLAGMVNGNRFYLHDGRARSPEEAILWHGGEAERARDAYRNASPADRQSLIHFLESL